MAVWTWLTYSLRQSVTIIISIIHITIDTIIIYVTIVISQYKVCPKIKTNWQSRRKMFSIRKVNWLGVCAYILSK